MAFLQRAIGATVDALEQPAGPPDPARQAQARRYARLQRGLWLLNLALSAATLLTAAGTGLAAAPAGRLADLPAAPVLAPVAVAWMLGLLYLLVTAPVTVLSGFILPRRFGQSTQSFGGWLLDLAKAGMLGACLGSAAVAALYALLRWLPGLWWLAAALALFAFTVLLAQLAPVLIVPLFFKLTPLPEDELTARLRARAAQAGARVHGVYTMNLSAKTTAANAALMGLGRTRRIVLGDTLLDRYTADEIDAVFAHELGHHVHRDIPRGLAFQLFLTLVEFGLVARIWQALASGLGLTSIADPAGLPALLLLFGALGLLTMPLRNGWSRWVEAAADRYALAAGVAPASFRSMMWKLAGQNLAEIQPPRWVEWLFYDHPSIQRRLALAGDD